ncbi:hypothetical protein LTR36_006856 [Oleoguttula mirabilis]|uniref:Alkaline phytoceramidase n=1 Tax=Oleoguttula mirabilis TaxID=1507867 RepID=A0AAV9JB73_9PEZI|nr:hypothetical protein LTR36_006856 [Oleoguttula mirabilis]
MPDLSTNPIDLYSFCEEDFIISGFVGEFVNTLTNLAYILFAYQALRRLNRDHGSAASKAIYYGLAIVGLTSGLFHALLKYHAQISDDTGMLIASGCVLHRAMTFDKSPAYQRNFSVGLLAFILSSLTYHSLANEQTVHELTFFALILAVGVKVRALIHQRVTKPEQRKRLTRLSLFGAGSMVFGYFLWQLDHIFCSELTSMKRQIGMPWSFLLEFHGWWHILTAVGAYTFMVMVERLTSDGPLDLSPRAFAWLPMTLLDGRSSDGAQKRA